MNRVAALLFVTLAGCAGCLAVVSEDVNDAPLPRTGSILHLQDCWEGAGRFLIPLSSARDALPAGFEPVVAGPRLDQGLMFITAFDCHVSIDRRPAEKAAEMTTMVLVNPPERHKIAQAGFQSHGFLVDWITSSDGASAFYSIHAVPHSQGDIKITLVNATEKSRTGYAESLVNDPTFTLSTTVSGPAEPFGAGTVRLFYVAAAPDGDHLRYVDVEWSSIPSTMRGSGTLIHDRFGTLESDDMFHAWTYDWSMHFVDVGRVQ